MMKAGSTTRDNTVRRHSRVSIAATVVTNTTELLTAVPRVDVTALWAPITSLFRRLMSDPVWVRVKKAIGMRCTLVKSATRRS